MFRELKSKGNRAEKTDRIAELFLGVWQIVMQLSPQAVECYLHKEIFLVSYAKLLSKRGLVFFKV